MKVGIVGLGLIGGSLAKAYQRYDDIEVYGWDIQESIVQFAILAQAIDGKLSEEKMKECDLILLATYPQDVIDWVTENANILSSSTIVIDCSGTKQRICDACMPIAKQHGFTFVGGHPMAGLHQSGFKYSREDLFDGAPMVIVPPSFDDIRLLDRISQLLKPVKFGKISVTTAGEHDKIIAFTSQMAHVVSNAFVKSPTAMEHEGFSAGSYKDMTRVAWLNPDMWTELFFENKEALTKEIDIFIANLMKYRDALSEGQEEEMRALLEEGKECKRKVDGP